MHKLPRIIRPAIVALAMSISMFVAAAPAMANDPNPAGTHPVPACGKKLLPNNKHCVAPAQVSEVILVTSPASCTVLIEGNYLSGFDQILLDFDSLILTEAGYSSYLPVYQPGDPRNVASTSVTVNVDGSITISNGAICGKSLIVTSALFGTVGSSFYETVIIQS